MKYILMILLAFTFANAHLGFDELHLISKGQQIILAENKKIDSAYAYNISYQTYLQSKNYEIDYHFVLGIMRTESRFNPNAKSYCGAIGLMQLMPRTAKSIAKKYDIIYDDLYDITTNISIGTAYLKHLQKRFGNYEYVAAGYNGGSGGAYKYIAYTEGKIEETSVPKETRNYVPKVMEYYKKYKMYKEI